MGTTKSRVIVISHRGHMDKPIQSSEQVKAAAENFLRLVKQTAGTFKKQQQSNPQKRDE
jgi:hypothetical protein